MRTDTAITGPCSAARVLDVETAARSTLGKLGHYRRKAPYAHKVDQIVEATFAAEGIGDSLVRLNVAGLDAVCAYLGVPFRRTICSEMNLPMPDGLGPGEWAPTIAGLVAADAYLHPIGGRTLFRKNDFETRGVRPSS